MIDLISGSMTQRHHGGSGNQSGVDLVEQAEEPARTVLRGASARLMEAWYCTRKTTRVIMKKKTLSQFAEHLAAASPLKTA